MGDDGGKGSGRKHQPDKLLDRLRAAAQKNDPRPKSVDDNAKAAFGKKNPQ